MGGNVAYMIPDGKIVYYATIDSDKTVAGCKGISIGTAGDLQVEDSAGNSVTIPSECLAIGIQHAAHGIVTIKQASTTAAKITVWY